MRKGNYGIAYVFYAVLAFVLALFGQSLMLFLLTAFVIIAEKDEWTSKLSLQACGLVGIRWIVSEALGIVKLPFEWLNRIIRPEYDSFYYKFMNVIGDIFNFLNEVVDIVILVFILMAIAKLIKGAEPKLPIVSKFANWAYGASDVKKCPKCGAVVKGKFCDKCGTKLD